MTSTACRLAALVVVPLLLVAGAPPGGGPGQNDAEMRRDRLLKLWKYPGSAVASASAGGGAKSGPGGSFATFSAAAQMTTADSVEDVARYYEEKAGVKLTPVPHIVSTKADERGTHHFADDSQDRPLTLRLYAGHLKDQAVVLVVSRGEGEKRTHILWHYVEY